MKKSLLYLFLLLFTFQSNAQNYSLGLNGAATQYVNIPAGAAILGTGAFTIEAWVKTTGATNKLVLQQRGPGIDGQYYLAVNAGGNVNWFIYDGITGFGFNIVSNAAVNDGTWHHIAATREADGSGRVYIDGVLDKTEASAGPVVLAALNVVIGRDAFTGADYFTGDLEEIRIWNVARTQAQIKEFAFKAPANNATGLVAYYKANENGGTTLINSCTNTAGIDGTLVNTPTWAASPVLFGTNALNFDGVDDVVTTTQSVSLLPNFTLEGWVYNSAASAAGISFFGQNGALHFGFSGVNTLGGYTSDALPGGSNAIDWVFTPAQFPLNTWHHVAFTGDGIRTRIFFDGIERASVLNGPANYGGSLAPFKIGGEVWAPAAGYFNGSIDEVRVWSVARTQAQIQAGMLTELNPATQIGLLSYYTLNQGIPAGTNTALTNIIDNAGDTKGTLSGFGLTGATSNFVAQNPGFSPLPVNWLSFTAAKQGERVVLNWATSLEEETKDFVIEHSTDAVNWRSVGTELARNTAAANYYQFTHSMPDKTLNFYRLKQRDENGRFAYSKTVSVRFAGISKPLIYSNPISNGILSIRMEQAGQVQLFTQQGQLVLNKQLGAGIQQMNISHLAKGVYMVKFNDLTASIIVQ
ncbi:MAG: LamG-like jellyroll fold domain-containing protein [Lacibacter sp.]